MLGREQPVDFEGDVGRQPVAAAYCETELPVLVDKLRVGLLTECTHRRGKIPMPDTLRFKHLDLCLGMHRDYRRQRKNKVAPAHFH